jgi:hypothetical protein
VPRENNDNCHCCFDACFLLALPFERYHLPLRNCPLTHNPNWLRREALKRLCELWFPKTNLLRALLAFWLIAQLAAVSSNSTVGNSSQQSSIWDAPSEGELELKNILEQAQLTYGLKNSKTMKAMWQLSEYYLKTAKYSQAKAQLSLVKDVCTKDTSLCPVPLSQINAAYAKAGAGQKAHAGAVLYRSGSSTQGENLDFDGSSVPNPNPQPGPALMPKFWGATGSHPEDFKIGLDSGGIGGSKCCLVEARSELPHGFGGIIQSVSAHPFRGKQIRLTGYITTSEAKGAALWLRVDDAKGFISLDNMSNRLVKGTSGWTPYNCVLDVPQRSTQIWFGGLSLGGGSARFDSFKLESVVGQRLTSTAVSSSFPGARISSSLRLLQNAELNPQNLHFDYGTASQPRDWFTTGDHLENYEVGCSEELGIDGSRCGTIKCISRQADGCGSLMQTIVPGRFLGKRIRLSGFIKTKDADWAALWISVFSRDHVVGFDNGYKRQITGSNDWTPFSCTLDVPAGSTSISFGCLLFGRGQAFFDDLKLDLADDVKTTNNSLPAYRNLSLATSPSFAKVEPMLANLLNNNRVVSMPSSNASVWEAVTQEELNYKQQMEKSQIQNGFSHPETMRAMWQLAQYYLKSAKYAQAEQILHFLQDASIRNPKNSPVSVRDLSRALDAAASGKLALSASNQTKLKEPVPEAEYRNYFDRRAPANLNFDDNGPLSFRQLQRADPKLPFAWNFVSDHSNDYESGLDQASGRAESQCGYIKAHPGSQGTASLMQRFEAIRYAGKRVRFSAYLKTDHAAKAQLWLSIAGRQNITLGYDDMHSKPITGTTDWTKYACVLDVPSDSTEIRFGVMLSTAGQVWIDDGQFEIVGTDVPTTAAQ